MSKGAFQKHLEKVVERDLIIIDLERMAKPKRLHPLITMIHEASGYNKDQIKIAIKSVKRLIELNDYLEIPNDGEGGHRELLSKLKEL